MRGRRAWLLALGAALLIAAVAMALLKTHSDPRPGEPGGRGNVVATSGGAVMLLMVAALSARRRRRRREEGEGKDG